MLKNLVLFFVLGLALSFSAHASEAVCNELLGLPSLDQRMDMLFSAEFGDQLISELKPQVEAIYAQDPAMGPESLETIFNLYMGRRLENLPGHLRAIIWDVIENHTQVKAIRAVGRRPQFTGYADSAKGVVVAIPQKAFRTALDYVIRVHELEHIIQYHAIGVKPFRKFNPKRFLNRFLLERGAMRSEAAFILMFPKDYVIGLHDESIKNTEPGAYWFFKQAVLNVKATDQVEAYVEMMWKADRYSYSQFYRAHVTSYLNWGLTAAFASAPWWTNWIQSLGQ